jgi:hypothetical protein
VSSIAVQAFLGLERRHTALVRADGELHPKPRSAPSIAPKPPSSLLTLAKASLEERGPRLEIPLTRWPHADSLKLDGVSALLNFPGQIIR